MTQSGTLFWRQGWDGGARTECTMYAGLFCKTLGESPSSKAAGRAYGSSIVRSRMDNGLLGWVHGRATSLARIGSSKEPFKWAGRIRTSVRCSRQSAAIPCT